VQGYSFTESNMDEMAKACFFSAIAASSNKGMQSDKNARYAHILTADAGRYVRKNLIIRTFRRTLYLEVNNHDNSKCN